MNIIITKLQKWITPKIIALISWVVYVLSLVPLLWIGKYNYPSADDYTNGSMCHHAFVSGESIWGILRTAWERMVYEWYEWRGCFTASYLSALMPGAFGEQRYALTIWIMLAMLTFSTTYFLYVLLVKGFGFRKEFSFGITALLLFITVQCMIGSVEAFYWYSGAVNYTFLHGLSLIYLGLLIHAEFCSRKKRGLLLVGASVVGFLVGGGNQMTPLNTAIILVLVGSFLIWKKQVKKYLLWGIPVVAFFIGFALNLISPGNQIRAAAASGMNPIKAILVSFFYCLELVLGEWISWPVLLLVIMLVILFWKATEQSQCRFRMPGIVVLLGFCIVSAMFTPALFAVGNVEAPRIQSLTFMMYLLILTLCTGYVTGWIRRKWGQKKEENVNEFSAAEILCLLGTMVFFGFATVITVIPSPDYFSFSSAIEDLCNGDAQAYAETMEARIEAYQSGENNVTVDALPATPELLYFSDITPFEGDWENQGVCRFYQLDTVKRLP